jgi:hypothetical protein
LVFVGEFKLLVFVGEVGDGGLQAAHFVLLLVSLGL